MTILNPFQTSKGSLIEPGFKPDTLFDILAFLPSELPSPVLTVPLTCAQSGVLVRSHNSDMQCGQGSQPFNDAINATLYTRETATLGIALWIRLSTLINNLEKMLNRLGTI